jgi:hypothetical protein
MIAGGAIQVTLIILPYTNYTISQSFARGLFWTSIGVLLFGIVLIVIALAKHKQRAFEEKSLSLEQTAKHEEDNPSQFISARFESLMVEKGKLWVGCDVVLASRLSYAIEMNKVDVILWLPMGKGKHRYDMRTRVGEQLGSISSEAGRHDTRIRVHLDNDPDLSTKLLDYLDEHPYEYLPVVEGTVIITTDKLEKIRLNIPESSICIHNLGIMWSESQK